jgi:hypothetical protein
MDYSEKFEIVKSNIIKECKKDISDNWLMMFDMWLSCEASMVFPDIYKRAFDGEFVKYMTPDIKTLLWLSGKNIVFAIGAYMSVKEDANLNDVLVFTERFIENQLDDFDNWCDDIMMAMYEESSECERDNAVDPSGSHLIDNTRPLEVSRTPDVTHILDNLPKKVIAKIKSNISGNNLKDVKQKGIKGTLTYTHFIEKIKKQNGKCYICLQDFKYDGGRWCNFFPSADRIDNYDIHKDNNVAVACTYCNIRSWKEDHLGHEINKVCGECEGLNHSHEGYISTKSVLYRALGNNNTRIYEYAQNPTVHYLNKD